jgi:hypothetical protein
MSRALATIGTEPMEPVLAQALRTFVPYAYRFGYEIRIGSGDSQSRPASWAKVLFLQKLLTEYDEVLWLDADVVILDASVDLAASVGPDAYQAFAEWRLDGDIGLNVGVWFLRASKRTQGFLQAVWDSTQFINHRWWENAAVLALLGHSVDGSDSGEHSPWAKGTEFVAEEWNMFVAKHGLRPARFRHYATVSNERRERWMRADADRLAQNPMWRLGASRRWLDRHVPGSRAELQAKVQRHVRRSFLAA